MTGLPRARSWPGEYAFETEQRLSKVHKPESLPTFKPSAVTPVRVIAGRDLLPEVHP